MILHITFHIFVNFHRINITTTDANVIYFPIGSTYIGIEVQTVQVIFYICKMRLNECLRQNLFKYFDYQGKKKNPSRYYSYLFKEAIL